MTTAVVADYAQAAAEKRSLGVPHAQAHPQRVHHHHCRGVFRPIDTVGETHSMRQQRSSSTSRRLDLAVGCEGTVDECIRTAQICTRFEGTVDLFW